MDRVAEHERTLRARKQRFATEANKPTPPCPENRVAWAGGKIVKGNAEKCFIAMIKRKLANGAELTEEQAIRYQQLNLHTASHQPFAGQLFTLSAGNAVLSQRELAAIIVQHGGKISNTVHRKCHMLVASEQAIRRNTQAVRKAQHKFNIPIVSVEDVLQVAETGQACLPTKSQPAGLVKDQADAKAETIVAVQGGHTRAIASLHHSRASRVHPALWTMRFANWGKWVISTERAFLCRPSHTNRIRKLLRQSMRHKHFCRLC